jgi:eukaryotic-like serine/threonine-protein kinase
MPPRRIGPYRIEATLGRGGVGTVYRARDSRTGEPVALKLLSVGPALEPQAAKRFAMEFETLADLNHANIVRVYEAGVHEGYPFLAMELIEGLDLRAWLTLDLVSGDSHGSASGPSVSGGPLGQPLGAQDSSMEAPWTDERSLDRSRRDAFFKWDAEASQQSGTHSGLRALQAMAWQAQEPDTDEAPQKRPVPSDKAAAAFYLGEEPPTPPATALTLENLNRLERVVRLRDAAQQICEALAYIHARGLVHRDVKPANILVDASRRVKLMDFGLAKFLAADRQVTGAGRVVGTYRYVAPELLLAEPLDGRADLYSLGVLLFELLSGQPPYDATNPHDLWRKVLETDAPPLHQLNPAVDPVLAAVAHRLLRKSPEDRYQTAEEVLEALTD